MGIGRLRLTIIIPLFIVISVLLFLYHPYFHSPHSGKSSESYSTPRSLQLRLSDPYWVWESQYRSCLTNIFAKATVQWGTYNQYVDICNANYARQLFDVKYLRNNDDTKLAIMPRPTSANHDTPPCNLITLGIGGDIKAELEMQKLLPQCQFYGADPILESGRIYQQIGKYYELAISDRSGYYVASILENGQYKNRNISAVGFVEFLKKHLRMNRIDYLFLDNEGPEYKLMEQFLHGNALEKNDIVICQVSVEMHGPWEQHGMNQTKYNELLMSLLTGSALVPLWAESTYPHERWFYINVKHPFCVGKYLRAAFKT